MIKTKRTLLLFVPLAALLLFLLLLLPLPSHAAHESAVSLSGELSDTHLTAGVYRLDADVTYTGARTLTVGGNLTQDDRIDTAETSEVIICLNGYTLDMGSYSIISDEKTVLTVCDCGAPGTEGKLVGAVPADALLINSNTTSIALSGVALENTAPDGIGILMNGIVQLCDGATVRADGYSIKDKDHGNVYLGDCSLSGPVQIYNGFIYAGIPDLAIHYAGDVVGIELADPEQKRTEGSNSVVPFVNDDNADLFRLVTMIDGYVLTRDGDFLKLKPHLDDTRLAGFTAGLSDAIDGGKLLTIAPDDPTYTVLREPKASVGGASVALKRQPDGSYTASLSDGEAAKHIQITGVAGVSLDTGLLITDGLRNATVKAVTVNGSLFMDIIPSVGYAFYMMPPVIAVSGSSHYTKPQETDDTYREGAVSGIPYEGGNVTVTGTADKIILYADNSTLYGAYASGEAGAGKDAVFLIWPHSNCIFLSPPTVSADGVPVSQELIVKQEDGNYLATVPDGRLKKTITISGCTYYVPNGEHLLGATATLSLSEIAEHVKISIVPTAGMEFLEAPTVMLRDTDYPVVKEADGSYTATLPSTLVSGNSGAWASVSGNAGERLSIPGEITGVTVHAIKTEASIDNLLILMIPNAGKEFIRTPSVLLNGNPLPEQLGQMQEDGSYRVLFTVFSGDSITVFGTATADGIPVPNREGLSGAVLSLSLEADGSASLVIAPEAEKRFEAAPTVTVGGRAITVEKQADGSYTATVPAADTDKAIVVVGEATVPPPPLPVPDSGALSGAAVTTAWESDGSVTVTIMPNVGMEFCTAPTVTVDGTAIAVQKQADGSYTATVSAADADKSIAVIGAATEESQESGDTDDENPENGESGNGDAEGDTLSPLVIVAIVLVSAAVVGALAFFFIRKRKK